MSDLRTRLDQHSFANPDCVAVRHLHLDLRVDFESRTIEGTAELTVQRAPDYPSGPLVLDTRALSIERVECAAVENAYEHTSFQLGGIDSVLGAALTIELPDRVTWVRVRYSTSPDASALQWLEPAQTAGKRHPFLFTQSQSIHARSWIPLPDSPAARFTYSARVHVPAGLSAVMSAENNAEVRRNSSMAFCMSRPIPPYLIALAVGDLEFTPTGPRTAVWAEPSVVTRAAHEFDNAEQMLRAAETLFGPYQWGRFDILVMPPSFPFGGMENPDLIFVTPTLLAGDRSAVSVIVHELAHAWSGNLVTNATWSDFWLNEGFTTYAEYRLLEQLYGKTRADVERVLALADLRAEMAKIGSRDQILHLDLDGRDPDEGITRVPYVKGALFLETLERAFGRDRLDDVLRSYFSHFAFQSVTTPHAMGFLRTHLFEVYPSLGRDVDIDAWVTAPGLPPNAALPSSTSLARIEDLARRWADGRVTTGDLGASVWSAHERLHFLRSLPSYLGVERMAALDSTFRLTGTGNAEVLQQWLLMAIRNQYETAYPRLRQFLLVVGRRLFVRPLYEALVTTEAGRASARAIYQDARGLYHPLTRSAIDRTLGWETASVGR
jgi:leukotriene-A4 hydrolase